MEKRARTCVYGFFFVPLRPILVIMAKDVRMIIKNI